MHEKTEDREHNRQHNIGQTAADGEAAREAQQSAMGLSRDKITVRVYKGNIEKGRKEPDPLRAG